MPCLTSADVKGGSVGVGVAVVEGGSGDGFGDGLVADDDSRDGTTAMATGGTAATGASAPGETPVVVGGVVGGVVGVGGGVGVGAGVGAGAGAGVGAAAITADVVVAPTTGGVDVERSSTAPTTTTPTIVAAIVAASPRRPRPAVAGAGD